MRAYEQIAGMLRTSLQDRRLAAGTVLVEGQLASIFGASRTPVRQALEALLSEGWLSRFEGRGLVVGDGTAPPLRVALGASDFTTGLGEISRRRGWQKLYHEVERALIHCSVFGSYRINELEVGNHYHIGRTVARDILLQAERIGILAKDESAHWVTVPLDENRLNHLYDLRELLEPAALISAQARIPQRSLAQMQQRLADAISAYPDVSPDTLGRLEDDLHVDCVGHAANPELLQALARARCTIISSRHILGSVVAFPTRDPFLEEHERVLHAMQNGDEALVRRTALRHLRSARDKVLDRLRRFREGGEVPDLAFVGNAKPWGSKQGWGVVRSTHSRDAPSPAKGSPLETASCGAARLAL